jgi:YidC/Oxa1 family membrane protein insertase
MQQKIMKYMMIFMGFMFYKVASGLCLYFIASSIWGIAERKLLPAPSAPGLAVTNSADSRSLRSTKNGSPRDTARPKKKR